jgi:hypothetical protein
MYEKYAALVFTLFKNVEAQACSIDEYGELYYLASEET